MAVLSNGDSDSSNKGGTGEDESKEDDGNYAPIKIGCGKDQYACGDQCYSLFRFNDLLVQYRCNDNVLDKSKFILHLKLQLDSIDEIENITVNGAELVFE